MNLVGNNVNNSQCAGYSSQTAPSFKGNIGQEFVRELEAGRDVEPAKIMEAVKGTFGPSTEKVKDVLEELRSSASKVISDNIYYTSEIERRSKQIEDTIAKNTQSAKERKTSVTESITNRLQQQEQEIAQQEAKIGELNNFANQYNKYRMITYDEARVLSPQETIATIQDMSAGAKEAHEDIFNFLMTGKGGEKAVKRANQGVELWKSYGDGVFRIPDVESVAKENKGYRTGSAPQIMLDTMKMALAVHPKGTYICAGPIRKQVSKNAVAILSPLYGDTKAAEKDVEKMLKEAEDIQRGIAVAREGKLKDHDEWTYAFNPNNYHDAEVIEYRNGQQHNSWGYSTAAYYFGK